MLKIFVPFCPSREYEPKVLKNQVVRALKQLELLEFSVLTGLVSDVAGIVFAYRQDE